MTVNTLAEAKAHLSELVNRVAAQHERVTVTVYGKPTAVLISVDDLEALEETIAILSDSAAMADIAGGQADIAAGRVIDHDEMAAIMKNRRSGPGASDKG